MRWKILAGVCGVASWMTFAADVAMAGVWITPANPTSGDTIVVGARGAFPNSAWGPVGLATCSTRGDTLAVVAAVDYCGGQPTCSANDQVVSYVRYGSYPPLPAGVHVLEFTEQHTNPADPIPTNATYLAFAVTQSGLVPTARPSWGRLKAVYR